MHWAFLITDDCNDPRGNIEANPALRAVGIKYGGSGIEGLACLAFENTTLFNLGIKNMRELNNMPQSEVTKKLADMKQAISLVDKVYGLYAPDEDRDAVMNALQQAYFDSKENKKYGRKNYDNR